MCKLRSGGSACKDALKLDGLISARQCVRSCVSAWASHGGCGRVPCRVQPCCLTALQRTPGRQKAPPAHAHKPFWPMSTSPCHGCRCRPGVVGWASTLSSRLDDSGRCLADNRHSVSASGSSERTTHSAGTCTHYRDNHALMLTGKICCCENQQEENCTQTASHAIDRHDLLTHAIDELCCPSADCQLNGQLRVQTACGHKGRTCSVHLMVLPAERRAMLQKVKAAQTNRKPQPDSCLCWCTHLQRHSYAGAFSTLIVACPFMTLSIRMTQCGHKNAIGWQKTWDSHCSDYTGDACPWHPPAAPLMALQLVPCTNLHKSSL